MMLDIKHRINKIELVALGGLDGCYIRVREVFKSAILANSAAIIVAHNHPSDDATPSSEDIKLTESLVKAGELLDIPVLDHIILGEGSYSFKNDGRI
jgi:DNA repair protein RadC